MWLNFFCRYLADLMDNSELIRNIALAGHLHTGKVRSTELLNFTTVMVTVCFCVLAVAVDKKMLLIHSLLVLLTVCFCGLPG